MRAFEFLIEATVGREFNHLEDLVFTNPEDGAKRAVQIIKDMEQDSSDVAIKWDGYPTLYWGRDDDGTFRLVGKNNWGREEGKSGSPEELKKFIDQVKQDVTAFKNQFSAEETEVETVEVVEGIQVPSLKNVFEELSYLDKLDYDEGKIDTLTNKITKISGFVLYIGKRTIKY